MRLIGLRVENFRALEEMEMAFAPMTVIIGENDVGKTSCMLAIRTLFEEKRLTEAADFFMHNTDVPVVMQGTFLCDDASPEQALYVDPNSHMQVRASYSYNQPRVAEVKSRVPRDERFQNIRGQAVGDLRATLGAVGAIQANERPLKADAQDLLQRWADQNVAGEDYEESWVKLSEADFARLLPDFVLVPVDRGIEANLRMTEKSLLGQLFRPLLRDILTGDDATASLQEIQGHLKDGVAKRVIDLQELLQEQLNNRSVTLRHGVELDLIQGVVFDFDMDDERAQNIPIANRGAGVRNNLILGMFRLLAQYGAKDFILGIEEPENSLHPRGQREMLWALQHLARTAQVICTTHSSIFVDLGRLEDNVVLTRTARGNTLARSFQTEDLAALRQILGIRISDALLSGGGNCAIIVEGDTELHAYPHFFRMAGHDARALGISIISAEGSDFQKIKSLLLVLNRYDIPAFVVLDKNAEQTKEELDRYGQGGPLPCLRGVFVLSEGSFEACVPLDVAVAVINENFPGEAVRVEDIDPRRDRGGEFQRVLYEKKGPGARFEYFKVKFGHLVGHKMLEEERELPEELRRIVDAVAAVANEV
ncbi:MAG TPA: AAA family ATPase [Phycisphaerae bacterium]|nr:AAA family ATPase [Phycisphaerae bacterium]